MIRLFLLTITIISMGLLASCDDDNPVGIGGPLPTPKYLGHYDNESWLAQCCGIGDTIAVDSGFEVWFGGNAYDSINGKHIEVIGFSTKQEYFCNNQYLITHVTTSPGAIAIEVEGVQLPSKLISDGISQSYGEEMFRLESGDYAIDIKYKNQSFRFILSVSDTSMSVRERTWPREKDPLSVTLLWDLYWRMRINECVLFCESELPENSQCEGYIDSMGTAVELNPVLYPPYGIRPAEAILPMPGLVFPWSVQYFLYRDTLAYSHAGEILKAYAQSLEHQGIRSYVYMVDYRGQVYSSWYDVSGVPPSQIQIGDKTTVDFPWNLHRQLSPTLPKQ